MTTKTNNSPPSFLRFEPRYETGARGSWLVEKLSRSRLASETAAASIEFSTSTSAPAKVGDGLLAGATWPELVESFGERLAGERGLGLIESGLVFETRFLGSGNTDSRLMMLRPRPTDESGADRGPYYQAAAAVVLESAPEARVYYGRRHDLDENAFTSQLRRAPGPAVLQDHEPEPGRALIAPPGVPHLIGRGVLAYYASASVEDGRDGTATTLGAATVGVPSERLFVTGLGQIVGMNASAWLYSTDVFCTVRLDLRSAWEDQGTASHQRPSFVALTAIQGSALLTSETDTETIAAGQTVIASARCANFRINPAEGGASILKTWLPDHAAEIERPLSRQGATQREIEALYGFFGRRK